MNIYQVLECYSETTTIITEDLNLALAKVSDDCVCNTQLDVWNNGIRIFSSNQYEEGENCYDSIYTELMTFLQTQNNQIKE